MLILRSPWSEPVFNCALEKYLLSVRTEDFLLFYINKPSVIVGRNQAIEAECDTVFCKENNIPIIKRLSGGGTVWHDQGNINWAFITKRDTGMLFDGDPLAPLIDALANFGVDAVAGVRKEILVDGYKISGTASYSTAGRQIFHGTMLHNSDLETMHKALAGNPGLRGKKIASIPSPTVNLIELSGGGIGTLPPQTEVFLDKLISFFLNYYGQGKIVELTSSETALIISQVSA